MARIKKLTKQEIKLEYTKQLINIPKKKKKNV